MPEKRGHQKALQVWCPDCGARFRLNRMPRRCQWCHSENLESKPWNGWWLFPYRTVRQPDGTLLQKPLGKGPVT